jgi:hypothetical protein
MSTSLLYHAFGIRGYEYVRTDYQDGRVIFTIMQEPEDWRCSACGAREVHSRGHVERCFRSLPIGRRMTAAGPAPTKVLLRQQLPQERRRTSRNFDVS